MSSEPIRVLVWDEHDPHVPASVYPESIRGAVCAGLRELGGEKLSVSSTHLDEPGQGAGEELLAGWDACHQLWGGIGSLSTTDEALCELRW